MLLLIDDRLLIEDVQDRFSDCFQGLKIEFYSIKTNDRKTCSDEYLISPKSRIRGIRKSHFNGLYEIKSWYSVNKVTTDLKRIYGLNARIFRCENGMWVEIDCQSSTLQQQNSIAENANRTMLQRKQERVEEYVLL